MKPYTHQRKSLAHAKTTDVVLDCSDAGCVSADTEFLTPHGWERIDQYRDGDRVAQFHPDSREIEFVAPLEYIKRPCTEMVIIAPVRGTSQRLSPEHRVLYYRPDGSYDVCSAIDYMHELHARNAAHLGRKFCTTFSVKNDSALDLSDVEIQLMVAVIADGHFGDSTRRCVIRVKKDRKIDRLRSLLLRSGIDFNVRVCGGQDPDFVVYTFDAPRREKEFTSFWWGASQRQLELIAQELPHWDSAIDPRPSNGVRFSSTSELSANFAQYAFAAAKMTTSCKYAVRDRTKQGRGISVEYYVHAFTGDGMVGPGRENSVYLAPNPEGFKYCFEVPSSFLLLRHDGYIFATGNTGKTGVVVWDFEARRKKGGGCALVLGPKSLLRSAWYNDFEKFAPKLKVVVATAEVRAETFAEDADVYVTNHDAVKWLAKQPKKFFEKFDSLFIDESTAYKHATSQRSKAVAKIVKYFRYRRAMTATPNSRSITDVWHQVFLLDGGQRLGRSFFQFRNTVCQPAQVGRSEKAIQWTDKEGAEEAVFGLLQDIVIRHKLEECVDIPVNHRYTVEYELTPKQRKAYDEMRDKQMLVLFPPTPANLSAKLLGKKKPEIAAITAVHAAVALNKLLQIASGAVYESPEKYHLIDNSRYAMAMDLAEERVQPLIFFQWKHQRDALIAEAKKRGLKYGLIDGSVSQSMREAVVTQYQMGQLDGIFAHPKSAAHGLTLTRGKSTIWVSPTADAELFEQGSRRQHRIGQTEKTEVVTILAKDTQDERVYNEILVPKQKRMTNLLDLFTTV